MDLMQFYSVSLTFCGWLYVYIISVVVGYRTYPRMENVKASVYFHLEYSLILQGGLGVGLEDYFTTVMMYYTDDEVALGPYQRIPRQY